MIKQLFAIFLCVAVSGFAQTAKSKADLYTEIDTTLASGGQITAAQLRGVFKNVTASAHNTTTEGTAALASALATKQDGSANLTTFASITPSANVQSFLSAADYGAMRTALGLVIGTNVQAYDADLSALAALSGTNTIYYRSASNDWSPVIIGSNLTFSGGTLAATGGSGSGDVVAGSITTNQIAFISNSATKAIGSVPGFTYNPDTGVITFPGDVTIGGDINLTEPVGVPAGGTGFSTIGENQIYIGGAGNTLQKVNLIAGDNVNIVKSGGNLTFSSTAAGTGTFPLALYAMIPTADVGSLPSDWFVGGLYGTTAWSNGDMTGVKQSLGTVAVPVASPPPGVVLTGQVVTLTSDTADAFFRTTTSGTDPTYDTGTLGNTFTVTTAGTWEAIAGKPGHKPSAVVPFAYTIDAIPTLLSASVDGTALTLTYSEAVTRGAGYSNAHFDLDASTTGSNLGVTYVSGDGTTSHAYTVASAIVNGETVDLDFSGAANSIEDSAGQDLLAIVSQSVTNATAPSGFAPDDLSSLRIWHKSESLTGSTGATVASWADSTTNAYDASTTAGKEPTILENAINTSMRAIVTTRSTSNFMKWTQSGALGITNAASGLTVVLVMKPVNYNTQSIYFKAGTTSSTNTRIQFKTSGTASLGMYEGRRLDGDSLASSSTFTMPATGSWRVIVLTVNWATGNAYVHNGATTLLTQEPMFGTTGTTTAGSSGIMLFGSNDGGSGTGADAQYAEVLVFNAALSDADRASVVGYLNTKFGL